MGSVYPSSVIGNSIVADFVYDNRETILIGTAVVAVGAAIVMAVGSRSCIGSRIDGRLGVILSEWVFLLLVYHSTHFNTSTVMPSIMA